MLWTCQRLGPSSSLFAILHHKQRASTAAAAPFETHTDAPSTSRVAAQLCFPANTASSEAIGVLIKRYPDSRLDEKQGGEMQHILSQRVLTMTRQAATTARRPKKPPWFNQFFERDDVMTTAAVVPLERLPTIAYDGLETESATASNIEWHFGWNDKPESQGIH